MKNEKLGNDYIADKVCMEEIRSKNRNMSNYRILKAMITECLGSNDISYINMILSLAETIVDDAINHN